MGDHGPVANPLITPLLTASRSGTILNRYISFIKQIREVVAIDVDPDGRPTLNKFTIGRGSCLSNMTRRRPGCATFYLKLYNVIRF